VRKIGKYEIFRELGRGAMGVVFKARDPLIGRLVALKTIALAASHSDDLRQRFYREAQAAGGLQHPNIVTVYEMGEEEGVPFIAMEYLEGESLDAVLSRNTQIPLAQKLGYVVQVCRALSYAHEHGIVHRDIKPGNIMVTRDGTVKVVDFGIARMMDTSKTQTGVLLGTLAYMSPELV
jgi:serine/threonine protein kinase